MDGVDGYDFVQLQDDVPEDNTVLQVNGVPVFVNPKLLVNTAGDLDLRLRDQIIDGVNGYDYVQIPDEDRAKADFQFLNQQFYQIQNNKSLIGFQQNSSPLLVPTFYN